MTQDIYDVLSTMQKTLSAPKTQYNNFGKYHYRSCEDILEAVKKILPDGAYVSISDSIEMVGDRHYVVATATFNFKGKEVSAKAYAREALSKKGMDEAQVTGSTSSYARKYALNGLFCIDDSKDSDVAETAEAPKFSKKAASNNGTKISRDKAMDLIGMIQEKGRDLKKMCDYYKVSSLEELTQSQFNDAIAMLERVK